MYRLTLLGVVLILVCRAWAFAAAPISVGADSDGKTIAAKVDQDIAIHLEGNPTTGYTWTLTKIDGESVKPVGEIKYEGGNDGRIGSGGVFIASFHAVKTGKSEVHLDYHRPWEKDKAAARTFVVTIDVK